jgi:hypothetical protein
MQKTYARCILAPWAADASPHLPKVKEGLFTDEELLTLNEQYYGIFHLPNYPSTYTGGTVDGSSVDNFGYCFVDMDLKDGVWPSKGGFSAAAVALAPSRMVDSGNGVHCYWRVSDLDAASFLRLQRRLCRVLRTDEAVAKIFQLMRTPGYVNTKRENAFALCQVLEENDNVYTCEQLSEMLPPITAADETYCRAHYDKTFRRHDATAVSDAIPLKFLQLIKSNKEVKEIWSGGVDDRSKSDYRLGHIMLANGFSKAEAMSVLVNTGKALARAPIHRIGYAEPIVDKIWEFETVLDTTSLDLSSSVRDILVKSGDTLKGTPFRCWPHWDDTQHGYRLGQVIGLVAGVGVGKTAVALDMFMGFVQTNPDYVHFFVALEQPKEEIADRWKTMCGTNEFLHDKVHILSNYADDGSYRNLSLDDIKDYLLKFQKLTGKKVGAVVIDHIGVLKKQSKDGENQGLMDICHQMKAFAIQLNVMMVMQSQAPREKAGIGDLELNKDAAYGTVFFEAYCDYLITIWQPLKRVYKEGAPTVTAYKFGKIRHKKQGHDKIQEDTCYALFYDPETQRMRDLTQDEEKSVAFFTNRATSLRKEDKKTALVTYTNLGGINEATTQARKDAH